MHISRSLPFRAARSTPRGRAGSLLIVFALSFAGCSAGLGSRHRALQTEVERDGLAPSPEAPFSPSPASDSAVAPPSPDLFLGGEFLSRNDFITTVLERNPSVRSAQYAFRAALAHYPQSISLDDPQLAYGVTPLSFGAKGIDSGHKVELRQRLPFPGKLRLRGEESLAHAEAAKHDLASVRLELATAASLLFDDYYYLGRAIAINREHVELLEAFKSVATSRYEAGNGSQQDPLAAETELAHLVHQDVVLETNIALVAQRMNTLLHRSPDHHIPPPPITLEPPEVPDLNLTPEQVALANRPELRATAAHVDGQIASVEHARREFLPDVTLVGAYSSLWQVEENRPFVGLSIDVPLQLGRRRAALNEAEANLGGARAAHDRVIDDVRLSAARAGSRLHESEHVLMLFRDRLLPPARDRVEAVRAGFESGRETFLSLIEADRSLRTTTDGLEKARAERSQARAEFLRALGLHVVPSPEESK